MNFKIAIISLLIGVSLVPTLAQDAAATQEASSSITHAVVWDGYSFSYPDWLFTDVTVSWRPASIIGNGPLVRPDVVNVNLTSLNDDMIFRGSLGGISFYNAADLTDDTVYSAAATDLQTLLNERPDLNAYEGLVPSPQAELPYVPLQSPRQTLITRAAYFETDSFDGIAYLVVESDFDGALNPTKPHYIFQGLSHDEKIYISLTMYMTADVAEAADDEQMRLSEPSDVLTPYLADSLAALDTASSDQFEPGLDVVQTLIQTIKVK